MGYGVDENCKTEIRQRRSEYFIADGNEMTHTKFDYAGSRKQHERIWILPYIPRELHNTLQFPFRFPSFRVSIEFGKFEDAEKC